MNGSGVDRCSFCGKSREQVRHLITGAATLSVAICDESVRLCNMIIAEKERRSAVAGA